MMEAIDYGPDLHPIPISATEAPASREAWMAYTCYQTGDMDKAEQICRYLIAKDPRDMEATHLSGMIAFHRNQMDVAAKLLRRVVNGFEDPPPLYLLNLGLVVNAAGQCDEAIRVLQHLCKMEPDNLDFNTKLAAVMLNADRLDEAEATIQRSLQIQPMDMQAMETARKIQARKMARDLPSPPIAAKDRQPDQAATAAITDYTLTISARNKTGAVAQMLREQFASLPLKNIDSLFGFHQRCRLYGGRAFKGPDLDDADLNWMYANGIGYRIPLTSKLVTREDYEQARPFLEMHHREGNSVIVVRETLAQWIRQDFPLYKIEASVIRETDTAEKLLKALEVFDTIVPLPEPFNTNYALLDSFPKDIKARIRLFLNAGCMYHCPNRICYTSFSKMNKEMPGVQFECSQRRFSYFFTQGMTDFPMQRYLEMGYRKFKVLRARIAVGGTGN